jgi:hypothetical protein
VVRNIVLCFISGDFNNIFSKIYSDINIKNFSLYIAIFVSHRLLLHIIAPYIFCFEVTTFKCDSSDVWSKKYSSGINPNGPIVKELIIGGQKILISPSLEKAILVGDKSYIRAHASDQSRSYG